MSRHIKNSWSPALSLFKVMLSISSLLTDPNPKDPLVPTIATEYMKRRATHDKTARSWVQLYARPPTPPPPPRIELEKATAKGKSKGKVAVRSVPTPTINLVSDDGPIEITDEDDTNPSGSVARKVPGKGKRKRDGEGSTSGSKRRASGTSAASGAREVIVIDDD